MERVIGYLAGLSRRERWLLALLLGGALPLAAVFGLILPLSEARQSARIEVQETRLMQEWVAARAGEYLAQGAVLGVTEQGAPIGISGIEQSLVAAGLRQDVSELANSGHGGVSLRFEAVAFTGLTSWLRQNAGSWGYDLEAFRFARGSRDDLVEAELRLVPVQ